MASKKLDNAFKEIHTKYKDASETEIQRGINGVEARLQKLRGDVERQQGEIAGKQQLVQLLEGKLKNNPNSKGLLSQIEASKKEIATIQKSIDKKQAEIDKAEKRKMNLQGYKENKQVIIRTLNVIERFQLILKKEIEKRDEAKLQLASARKMLDEVNKKLMNEKATMEMTNDEYNDLLRKRDELPKQIQKFEEVQRHAEQRIKNLQEKIKDCNDYWKILFVNKPTSMLSGKKYTKTKEGTKGDELKARTTEENSEEAKKSGNDITRDTVATNGAIAKGNDIENPDDLFEVKEEKSRLEKIYGVLRKVPGLILFWPFKLVKATVKAPFKLIKFTYKKIKQLIKWLKQKGIGDTIDMKKKENPKEQSEPKKEEKKEMEQPVQETQKEEPKVPRKSFIDGLREYTDKDYREKIRNEKQKAYIHKHEAGKTEKDVKITRKFWQNIDF